MKNQGLQHLKRTSIVLAVAAALPCAQAATDVWLDNSNGNWTTGTNWSLGSAPSDASTTAQFGSLNRTSISTSSGSNITVGALSFVSAPAYTFTLGQFSTFSLLGAGIQLNSSSAPTLMANTAHLVFGSSAAGSPSTSAGNAILAATNGGDINFYGTSTNADAQLSLDAHSVASFNNSSTAGSALARLTNNNVVNFYDSSNAGAATINMSAGAQTYFYANSSAQNATLNLSGASGSTAGVVFSDNASAGSSNITLGANTQATFQGSATAGSANIHLQSGASLSFWDSATGGSAKVIADGGSSVDFIFQSSGVASLGSLQGNGLIDLAGVNLTIGGANSSTTIGGSIQDDGAGGSLTKVGSGTLTLSGTDNSYSGGTVVNGGTLNVAADGSLGQGGAVTLAGGTLQLGAGGFNSARSFSIGTGGGTIDTGAFTNNVLSGSLSGSGALQKVGTGTLILVGNDTVSGGTTIAAGTLQIGNGGTTGSLSGNVVNNGTLAFNRSDASLAFAGVVSGSGQLSKMGSGKVTLTGNNTYTGGTTITAGTLQIGNGGTSGSITGNVVDNGALIFSRSDSSTFSGAISGTGGVTKQGNGTLVYTGANTYTGATTIGAGTLQVGGGGTSGSIAGDVNNAGTLIFDRSDNVSYSGAISGAGAVSTTGGNTLIFTGANTYTGGTTISAGTLQIGNGGTSGTITGNVTDNGSLVFNRSDSSIFSGVISGSGAVTKLGSGTLTYTGANTYTATTTVSAGTLQIGNGGTSGSVAGNIANAAAVAFNRSDDVTYGGAISGTGSVTQSGADTLTFTGANTYTGGTTISSGTLRIGNGSTSGSITGNIANAGALIFNRSDSSTFDGVISGSGSVTKTGGGTLTYTGANTYTGPTTVSGGTLQIGNGGTSGSINGGVTDNGTLAFNRSDNFNFTGAISGSGGVAQNGGGVLTLTGDNSYGGGTSINSGVLQVQADKNLGASTGGITFGGGTLQFIGNTILTRSVTLASSGTLDAGQFNATISGVISGSGTLTKAGTGTVTYTGANTYTGGTTVSAGTLQIGDGGTGGSLIGDVTDSGALAFDHSDSVTYGGSVSGSGALAQIGGGTLILTGSNSYTGGTTITAGTLQIGNGGSSGSLTGNVADNGALVFDRSDNSTFNGVISGTGSVTMLGSGVLTYTGANTYTGATTISEGTLQIGNGGTSGAIAGGVVDNGTLAFNRSDTFNFTGGISGSGSVAQNGSGVLTLTGTNTYSGGTSINAGILQVLNDNNLGAANAGLTFGGGTLQLTGNTTLARSINLASSGTIDTGTFDVTVQSVISGQGSLNKIGSGTLALAGANTYNGNTNITAGTLQIGTGGTTGTINGDVNDGGTLAFDRADTFNFGGNISGTGSVSQSGSGTLTLTGNNSYLGGTFINSGILQILNDSNLGSSTGGITFGGGTLQLTGNITLARNITLNAGGGTIDTNGFNATLTRAASGTGSLTKASAGVLTVVANNTYTGGTIISGGTLQIGNGGTTGAITGNVTNNGALAFNRADNVTYAGVVSGSGDLAQMGPGTLTLTGTSAFTGQTLVSGGTLTLAGGKITSTSAVQIAQSSNNVATLYVTGSGSSLSTAGQITVGGSGVGTLTVDNGATITASSINLGQTRGSTGTLNIGTGGASGGLTSATIVSGAGTGSSVNLNFNDSTPYTLASALNNSLALNMNGTGTVILTNTNSSYSGGTTLNSGILRINSNANLGSTSAGSLGLTFNGGTLQLGASITNLNRSITLNSGGGTIDTGSNNLTDTGNVSGQGALVKLGSGTLLLNGTSSYSGGTTVSAGTLRGTTTSLQGDIVNNATVTFAQVNDGVYSGVMSGTGVFSKLSNGNLTLTGNSTYTGATTVTAGTLTVNGGLQSAVTVGTGGTLAGNGTLGRSVDESGKLSAGDGANPMGTLQIVGSLNMGSNSTLVVHAAPDGTNSKVVVGGAVTLNNGNVSVIGNNAEFLPSTQYTILTAQGGVTGTFNTPSTDTAFLVPTLTYDTKDVFLTLARNDTSLQSVAQTRSQVKAATYLQNLGDDAGAAPVVDRVLMLSAKNAPSAFASISGNALANLGHISQKLTGRLMDSLANRLGDAGDGSDPFEYAPAELGLDALPTSDGGFLRESSLTRGLWVRNFNQQGGIKSDGNGAASDWLGGGTALGFDLPLSSQTVVGASYLNSLDRVQLDSGRTGVARISTPQFVAYMSHASGGDSFLGWQVRGLAGYSHPTISSSRAVVIGNDTTVATSTHSAQEISAAGEADLSQNFASFGLHEIVGLRSSRMDEAAYMESGSAAALQIAARVNQSLVSSMGTHLVVPMSFGSSLFDVRAMWRHELRDVGTGSSARLANSTSDSRFYADGTPMGRDSMTVGANYSARLGRNLALYGDYSLDVSKESGAQHNLLAGFRYLW